MYPEADVTAEGLMDPEADAEAEGPMDTEADAGADAEAEAPAQLTTRMAPDSEPPPETQQGSAGVFQTPKYQATRIDNISTTQANDT